MMVDPKFFTRDFFQSESRLMREVGISGTDTMITLPKEWGTPSCSGGQFRWLKLVHLRRQNKKRHERLKASSLKVISQGRQNHLPMNLLLFHQKVRKLQMFKDLPWPKKHLKAPQSVLPVRRRGSKLFMLPSPQNMAHQLETKVKVSFTEKSTNIMAIQQEVKKKTYPILNLPLFKDFCWHPRSRKD